jgi:putative folate metabolism gamma-glutamate ligase
MHVKAIQTNRIMVGESLTTVVDNYLLDFPEKAILAITSKVIALCQGRVVSKKTISKEALIAKEADALLKTEDNPYGLYLTLKNNLLIPSAGIDESNGDDIYILYPENIQQTAHLLWQHIRTTYQRRDVGILITDSHTTPMRRGVTGIALGWCGFKPLYSYVGQPDLYGHPLRVTQINLVDALATSAVLVMGEGSEQTPLALIEQAPKITFLDGCAMQEDTVAIPMHEDLYGPLFANATWIKRKNEDYL